LVLPRVKGPVLGRQPVLRPVPVPVRLQAARLEEQRWFPRARVSVRLAHWLVALAAQKRLIQFLTLASAPEARQSLPS
jgi:hypothetical protein